MKLIRGGVLTIKALSIKEPWLSMIVDGEKTIETRTWTVPTYLRGQDLLLVGSKKPNGKFAGKAACLVEIVDCQPMRKSDEVAACCEKYPNAKSWILRNIRPVWPVPIKGQLRIYDVDDELIRLRGDSIPENMTNGEREWFVKHGFIKLDELDFLL